MRAAVVIAVASAFMATTVGAQKLPPSTPVKAGSPVQIVGGAAPNTPNSEPDLATARRITRDEAMKLVKENKAVYVDVRSRSSYDAGHIPGALSIPNSQLVARMKEIPIGKLAITYCACQAEHTAAVGVLNLSNVGFKNAAALVGGWNEWTALGLPTAVSKKP